MVLRGYFFSQITLKSAQNLLLVLSPSAIPTKNKKLPKLRKQMITWYPMFNSHPVTPKNHHKNPSRCLGHWCSLFLLQELHEVVVWKVCWPTSLCRRCSPAPRGKALVAMEISNNKLLDYNDIYIYIICTYFSHIKGSWYQEKTYWKHQWIMDIKKGKKKSHFGKKEEIAILVDKAL